MPTTDTVYKIRKWATTQRNITTITAILVAIPAAHAFQLMARGIPGSFFLLTVLAVGVPAAYEDYWPKYDQTWKTVVWILIACAVTVIAFTVLYVAGTAVAGLSPFLASTGAFLVTYFGAPVLLSFRRR